MSQASDERDRVNRDMSAALRDIMKERGVTIDALADHLGLSSDYVSQRTNGSRGLSVDIIAGAAQLLRLSPRALMVEVTERMAR